MLLSLPNTCCPSTNIPCAAGRANCANTPCLGSTDGLLPHTPTRLLSGVNANLSPRKPVGFPSRYMVPLGYEAWAWRDPSVLNLTESQFACSSISSTFSSTYSLKRPG